MQVRIGCPAGVPQNDDSLAQSLMQDDNRQTSNYFIKKQHLLFPFLLLKQITLIGILLIIKIKQSVSLLVNW
jgi:hypothetical protein